MSGSVASTPVHSGQFDVRVDRPGRRWSDRPVSTPLPSLAGFLLDGDTVVIGHGGGWPRAAVRAIVATATSSVQMVHNRIDDELPYYDPGIHHVRHTGLMVGRQTRSWVASGVSGFVPNSFANSAALIRSGAIGCDVAVLNVSPPDRDGWCSLGTCSSYLPAAVERARVVIAQLNANVPRTFGTSIHMSRLDVVVEVDDGLHSDPAAVPDEASAAIARQVASLIDDGDTLQVGIGKIGNEVLARLSGHRRLRLWTETFTESGLSLLDAGVLSAGPQGEPPIVATFVTGGSDLYAALDRHPGVAILPVDHTNTPRALSKVDRLVAVNSALEIDLSGQINAESVGPRTYSGSGGHLDFAIGANSSPGGRYICALPSTWRGGSRIVAGLAPRTAVTVPRSLADIVVTEHGIAHLRGRTLSERAQALIDIAHPSYRDALRRAQREPVDADSTTRGERDRSTDE